MIILLEEPCFFRESPISPFVLAFLNFLCYLGLPINRTEIELILNSDFRLETEKNLFHHIFWHWFAWFFCIAQAPGAMKLFSGFLCVLINFKHIPTSLNLFKQNTTHFRTKFKLIETCSKPPKGKLLKVLHQDMKNSIINHSKIRLFFKLSNVINEPNGINKNSFRIRKVSPLLVLISEISASRGGWGKIPGKNERSSCSFIRY